MRTVVHLRSRAAAIAAAGLLVALLALSAVAPRAEAAPVPGKCPTGLSGLGTAASPCLIGNAAQLYAAMAGINQDTTQTGAATDDYELTADIDATTYAGGTAGTTTSFGPTENWAGINYFTGTFDGDGHTISNLNYTASAGTYTLAVPGPTATAGLSVGLFRVLDGATVENLGLHNVRAVSATANSGMGGVAVWSFDSNVTGINLTEPTMSSTAGGGSSWVGGLVGLAYANSYTHYGSTVSDGGTSVFRNDRVVGGSIADANRTGGIAGMATGPTTVADNYVNTTLSNPVHPVAGAGGQANTFYYVIGGLVGQVGTTYTTSGGTTAAGVEMTDNVIQGTIKGLSADHRSFEGANFASATVGYATVAGHKTEPSAPEASNWKSTNNLVSSAIQYTNETGEGLPGADGISVSPATIEAEATYSGTASGLTDATTGKTYDQLGWTFGNGGSSAAESGWGWSGTSPVPTVAPTITVGKDPVAFRVGSAPAVSALEAEAGASTNFGTLAVDDSGVNWSTPGTYTATLTATNFGFTRSRTLTVVVASGTVPLARSTGGLEASATAPSAAEVLKALGAVLPAGDGGTLAVNYPGGEPAWNTPGSYAVEVVDNGGSEGFTPASATIQVVAQPTVTLTNGTVRFRKGVTFTAGEVIAGAAPQATYSPGDSGTFSADISGVGTEVGVYDATITATDKYGVASAPVKVEVAIVADQILLGHEKPVFQATTSEPSEAAILAALAPVMPPGTTGQPTVSGYTAADFETPGSFAVTVSDNDGTEGVRSATATIKVVPVAVVTDTASTVYFNVAEGPTGAAVIAAAGAKVTAEGLPAPGSTLEATLPAGCGASAGTCMATLVGTDSYGFTTAPVEVTVEVSAASVTVAHLTTFFGASAAEPSQAALVEHLGAAVAGSTNGGTPVVDASGVHWDVPGTYSVTVGDSAVHDAAPPVHAAIEIVPLPVVTVPTTRIYLPISSSAPLSEAALLANADAELTDGYGNAVPGTLTADASSVNGSVAGTYTATIQGTNEYGITSAPVTITVVIYTEEGGSAEEAKIAEELRHAAEAKSTEELHQAAEAKQQAEAAQHAAEAKQRAAEEAAKSATNTPPAGKPTPESPAKPSLSGLKATGTQITGSVKVNGAGTLTATATAGKLKVGSARVKVTKAGTVHLKLALTKAAKAQLAQHNLKVTVKVTFKNVAGRTATTTKTVTLTKAG